METITKASPATEAERLFADLDKPSLHALSYALRHPDTWPEGFTWSYADCDQCAMGLAHELWGKYVGQPEVKTGASMMARAFAMPYGEAKEIFFHTNLQYRSGFLWLAHPDMETVTPEMVADQIDAYLARVE